MKKYKNTEIHAVVRDCIKSEPACGVTPIEAFNRDPELRKYKN